MRKRKGRYRPHVATCAYCHEAIYYSEAESAWFHYNDKAQCRRTFAAPMIYWR